MRWALVCAALIAAPLAAQTARFDGDWATGNPAACVLVMDSPDLAIRIRGGMLYGLESGCEMTNPTQVRGMPATLYDMQCHGEGQTWTYRTLLMIDADGALVQLQEGYARLMPRCTAASDPLGAGAWMGPAEPGSAPPTSK